MAILRNLATVEVLNPEIIDDLEQKSEAKQGKINAVMRLPDAILHRTVNAENVERLDNQVDKDEEKGIYEKFSIHFEQLGFIHGLLWINTDFRRLSTDFLGRYPQGKSR